AAGTPKETVRQGDAIYVYGRLAHHLVPQKFPGYRIQRFALLVIGVGVLACPAWREPSWRRLVSLAAASLVLAAAGAGIDGLLETPSAGEAALLKYYWFRLSDVAVPAALALLSLYAAGLRGGERPRAVRFTATTVALVGVAGYWWLDRQISLPPADMQSDLAKAEDPEHAWLEWLEVCGWVRRNTPADALFMTPDRMQSFKWYAERAELANWKHVPQDPSNLVTWQQRRERVAQWRKAIDGRDAGLL